MTCDCGRDWKGSDCSVQDNSRAVRLGVGIGLGLGIPVIVGAIAYHSFFFLLFVFDL